LRSRRGIVRSQGYSSHSPGPEETRHGVPSNRIRLKPSVCLAVVWRALAGRHGQPSVHATGTTRPTQRVSQAVDPMGSSRGWSGAPRDAWACLPSCSRANVPAAHRWGRSIAPVTDHATAVRRHRRRNEPHGRRCGSRVYGVDRQGVRTFAATPFDRGAALPAGVDARSARVGSMREARCGRHGWGLARAGAGRTGRHWRRLPWAWMRPLLRQHARGSPERARPWRARPRRYAWWLLGGVARAVGALTDRQLSCRM
jgi:hypothetical protein